ncbi:DUF6668 family protein [Actinoplanes sp. NPDC051343]|uniref:DUF6668 family protein n=1 Tax=Actinoplanes sp. NPDC051343 TaxID=3363906 RepID=UPI0037A56484
MSLDTQAVVGDQGSRAVGAPATGGGADEIGPEQRSGLSPAGFAWVAAHGGCGATTLASVLGGVDLGCRWPQPERTEPTRVLLVARTHAGGLRAASQTLNAMREGRHPAGMKLVAVVLVADAPGGLPRILADRIRLLRSVAPVYRIPWVASWRSGQNLTTLPQPLEKLGRLVQGPTAGSPGRA